MASTNRGPDERRMKDAPSGRDSIRHDKGNSHGAVFHWHPAAFLLSPCQGKSCTSKSCWRRMITAVVTECLRLSASIATAAEAQQQQRLIMEIFGFLLPLHHPRQVRKPCIVSPPVWIRLISAGWDEQASSRCFQNSLTLSSKQERTELFRETRD